MKPAPTLALVTNIPTPYRLAFLDVLSDRLRERDARLDVTYCARSEANRHWTVDLRERDYPWRVLPGLHPRHGDITAHLNPSVIAALRAIEPSWILLAGAWNTPTIGLALSRLCGTSPRIFWSEGHEAAVSVRDGLIGRARRAFYRRCDGFAVPNEASGVYASSLSGRPVPLLPLANTVDEEFFGAATTASREATRSRLGVRPDRLLAVTVAQLEDRKGVLELAAAYLASSPATRERLEIAILGTGSLEHELRGHAANALPGRLHLPGHCRPEIVRDWLSCADAFILPTKRDPNPLSVIEAAFAGKALFISERAGNSRELVIDGRTGYLHDPTQPAALRAMLNLLVATGPDGLSRLGAEAALLARSRFTRDAVAERFVDALLTSFPLAGERYGEDRAEHA